VTHGIDTSFLVAVEVACHLQNVAARTLAQSLRREDARFGIAPQVVAEFIHVVTDPRRFSAPLRTEQALKRAEIWWNAEDVEQIVSDAAAVLWLFRAMAQHRLGRKRVLDTLLAATFQLAGISSVLTLNPADFEVFGHFDCIPLSPVRREGATEG